MKNGPSIRGALAHLLPHNNALCVVPPGKIVQGTGQPILVPSLMRSGTHILIDLILNNFPAYRRRPLYIDLDHYLAGNPSSTSVLLGGSYILKTHFPNFPYSERASGALRELAQQSFIIRPVRCADEIQRSQAALGMHDSAAFRRSLEMFEDFWMEFPMLQIRFNDLADRTLCPKALSRISQYVGLSIPANPLLPPAKHRVFRVLAAKSLTRLLGHRSPVINTTIGFARSDSQTPSKTAQP